MSLVSNFVKATGAYLIFGYLSFATPLLGGDLAFIDNQDYLSKESQTAHSSSHHGRFHRIRKAHKCEKRCRCKKSETGPTGPTGATGSAGENGAIGPTGPEGGTVSASSSRYSGSTGTINGLDNLPIESSFVPDDNIEYAIGEHGDYLTIQITGRYHITTGFSGTMGTAPIIQVIVERESAPFYNVTIANSYNGNSNGIYSFPLSTQSFDLDLLADDILYINNTIDSPLLLSPDNSGKSTILELHRISDISGA